MDKSYRTEFHRTFLIDVLPDPLTRASSHLQISDNYIPFTRLRLRSARTPETDDRTYLLQQRFAVSESKPGVSKIAEIYLNDHEHARFRIFEGEEIRKNRYFHEFDGRTFSFDIYLGNLWGLNTAKTPFSNEDEMRAYEPPAFAIYEITGDPFFFGDSLVTRTYEDIRSEVKEIASAVPPLTLSADD